MSCWSDHPSRVTQIQCNCKSSLYITFHPPCFGCLLGHLKQLVHFCGIEFLAFAFGIFKNWCFALFGGTVIVADASTAFNFYENSTGDGCACSKQIDEHNNI